MIQVHSELKIQYILYGTSACHLCELAEKMINEANKIHGIDYEYIDIADDDTLLEKYGMTIPVFKCTKSARQLNWPFNKKILKVFIDGQ
jgi:hypothetical protein